MALPAANIEEAKGDENAPLIPPHEVKRRTLTGSWLSPLEQPRRVEPLASGPLPTDSRHKKFIAAAALTLDRITEENNSFFGELPERSFEVHPLQATYPGSGRVLTETLSRSLTNAPIGVPAPILPETVIASIARTKEGTVKAGALRYTWLEKGTLFRDGERGEKEERREEVFTYSARHHSKLEQFHDVRRPVFCINVKADVGEFLDLRLISILNTERSFLDEASKRFSKEGDSFCGLSCIDHAGRVFIDEKIVRRAAFHYSRFQQERLFQRTPLGPNTRGIADDIRLAHFIVMRSHLPELRFKDGRFDANSPGGEEDKWQI